MKKTLDCPRSGLAMSGILLACFASGELAMAQLPPAIMADRYLVQAERELAGGDPGAAVETLNRIVALQADHGLEIPDEFWFRRGQAAHEAGFYDLAIESLVRYLENAGQGGEHYLGALEFYDAAELARGPQPGEVFSDVLNSGGRGPEMVVIPAGQFRMGCASGQDCYNDSLPVHDVMISQAFAISKYEVTFADWDTCVESGGCGGYRPRDHGLRGTRPVVYVTWNHAQEYVSWLAHETGQGYRLLTEAEWEYVARAGSTALYSWGNEDASSRANCDNGGSIASTVTCSDPWNSTAPVGSFSANAFGMHDMHDMHGNVWEWVEDCWNESYAGAPSDGSAWLSGDCSKRIARGGSFVDPPATLRSSNRWGLDTGFGGGNFGFRVARTLTP